MKNNKGYTIMEAVIAMFLVVVMVGAVFSALLSSRRAIVSSTEKEEVLYSLQSAYGMIKECRSNPSCHLGKLDCPHNYPTINSDGTELSTCNALFTFNFGNLCKGDQHNFKYIISSTDTAPTVSLYTSEVRVPTSPVPLQDFDILALEADCTEQFTEQL